MLGSPTLSSTEIPATRTAVDGGRGDPFTITRKSGTSGETGFAKDTALVPSIELRDRQSLPVCKLARIVQSIGLGNRAPQSRVAIDFARDAAQRVAEPDQPC